MVEKSVSIKAMPVTISKVCSVCKGKGWYEETNYDNEIFMELTSTAVDLLQITKGEWFMWCEDTFGVGYQSKVLGMKQKDFEEKVAAHWGNND